MPRWGAVRYKPALYPLAAVAADFRKGREKEQAHVASDSFFNKNNHECLGFCYQHVLEPRSLSFASPAGEELMLVPCSSRGENLEL